MTTAGFVRRGKHVGVRELRAKLSHILKSKHAYFVTEHGKPVKAMIPYDTLLELLEMVEELKDRSLLREIAIGRKEYQEGGWVPAGNLKKKFDAA